MFTVKKQVKKDTDVYSSIYIYISSVEIYKTTVYLGFMELFIAFIARIPILRIIKLSTF